MVARGTHSSLETLRLDFLRHRQITREPPEDLLQPAETTRFQQNANVGPAGKIFAIFGTKFAVARLA